MAVRHDSLPGPARPQQEEGFVPARGNLRAAESTSTLRCRPTPVRELLAASGATLFVLAADADFVAAIRRAAGDRYPLVRRRELARARECRRRGRCGIALRRRGAARALASPSVIATLAAHADRLVTLVAADRAAAHEYVGLLSNGRIHRLLIKPPAIGATRLLIESAVARRLQLREASREGRRARRCRRGPASSSRAGVGRRSPGFGARGVARGGDRRAAGSAGGTVSAQRRSSRQLPLRRRRRPRRSATAAVARRAPCQAALALEDGRLAEPAGDNALEHYLAILALEPTDQAARNGLSSVVQTLFSRAEEALLAGSLETAAQRWITCGAPIRRAVGSRFSMRSSHARWPRSRYRRGSCERGPAAYGRRAERARQRAQPRRRAIAPRPAAAPRRRRCRGVSRSRRAASTQPIRASSRLRADLTAALLEAARLVSGSDVAAATALVAEARRVGGDLRAARRARARPRCRARERRSNDLPIAWQPHASACRAARCLRRRATARSTICRACRPTRPSSPGSRRRGRRFGKPAALSIQNSIATRDWATADAQLAALAQAPGGAIAAAAAGGRARGQAPARNLLGHGRAAERAHVAELGAGRLSDGSCSSAASRVGSTLELVVDRNGQPRNLTSSHASPPGRFDAAALAAVEQYRYVPFERDGRVYERRLRFRVRFQIQ